MMLGGILRREILSKALLINKQAAHQHFASRNLLMRLLISNLHC